MSDVNCVSIDASKRMEVMTDIHRAPVSEVKRMCSVSNAWAVGTGRPDATVSGIVRVVRVVPDIRKMRRAVIGRRGRAERYRGRGVTVVPP